MKHEWRKAEKDLYLPKAKPEVIHVPTFKFFAIRGAGDPNAPAFGGFIEALYSLAYAVRMSEKAGKGPPGFYEYSVYPLEGFWDVSDAVKKSGTDAWNKDDLVFQLMIRQPDFVSEEFAEEARQRAMKKSRNDLLKSVEFTQISEGTCIQMMHLGPYDDEPGTFAVMEAFCSEQNLTRDSKQHKEIYISDPRKVAPERLKTVLRFKVRSPDVSGTAPA